MVVVVPSHRAAGTMKLRAAGAVPRHHQWWWHTQQQQQQQRSAGYEVVMTARGPGTQPPTVRDRLPTDGLLSADSSLDSLFGSRLPASPRIYVIVDLQLHALSISLRTALRLTEQLDRLDLLKSRHFTLY